MSCHVIDVERAVCVVHVGLIVSPSSITRLVVCCLINELVSVQIISHQLFVGKPFVKCCHDCYCCEISNHGVGLNGVPLPQKSPLVMLCLCPMSSSLARVSVSLWALARDGHCHSSWEQSCLVKGLTGFWAQSNKQIICCT